MRRGGAALNKSFSRIFAAILSYLLSFFVLFGLITTLVVVPMPRQFGLIFRQEIYILPLVFILVLFVFSIRALFLKRIGYALLIAFFFIPISGLVNSGSSDQYILGGVIPWSDAFTNHLNALRFLYGGVMNQSTALRPISAVFYDLILVLTGQDFFALYLIVTFFVGLSTVLLVRKIETSFSGIAAIFVYLNAYFYIRLFVGTFMTEPVGFIFGNFAFLFFMKGVLERRQDAFIAASFLLSLSLNARPGPMIVLAAIGLWYFFVFLKGEKRRFLYAALAFIAMLLPFAFNELTARIVTNNAPLVNRQFAEFAYGLCLGGKSGYDTMFMNEMTALDNSANPTGELIRLCGETLRSHPENLWVSVREIFRVLIFDRERGAFSYFHGDNDLLIAVFRFVLMGLWSVGAFLIFRNRRKPFYGFLLYAGFGFFLSQFIIPPFAAFRMRYHASVIVLPAFFAAIPVERFYVRYFKKKKPSSEKKGTLSAVKVNHENDRAAAVITVLCTLFTLAAPFWIRTNPLRAPKVEPIQCAENEVRLFTRIDRGSYFYMIHQENLKTEHYPNFRLAYIRHNFHDTASQEMFAFTDAIEDETAVFRGLDIETYQDALVFAPLDLVAGREGFVQMCGNWIEPPILRRDRFFIPRNAVFTDQP